MRTWEPEELNEHYEKFMLSSIISKAIKSSN